MKPASVLAGLNTDASTLVLPTQHTPEILMRKMQAFVHVPCSVGSPMWAHAHICENPPMDEVLSLSLTGQVGDLLHLPFLDVF